MPCSDGRDYNDDRELMRRLDRATRVACELGHSGNFIGVTLTADTQAWLEEHEELDRQRLEREAREEKKQQLKKKALAKLSPEERKALGL